MFSCFRILIKGLNLRISEDFITNPNPLGMGVMCHSLVLYLFKASFYTFYCLIIYFQRGFFNSAKVVVKSSINNSLYKPDS